MLQHIGRGSLRENAKIKYFYGPHRIKIPIRKIFLHISEFSIFVKRRTAKNNMNGKLFFYMSPEKYQLHRNFSTQRKTNIFKYNMPYMSLNHKRSMDIAMTTTFDSSFGIEKFPGKFFMYDNPITVERHWSC